MDDDESRVVLELLQKKDREIHALTDAKVRLEEKVDAMRWDLELAQGGLDYSAAFNTQLLAFEAQLEDLRTKTDLALQPRQITPDTRQAMALEQRLQRGEAADSLLHQRLHSMFQANCELIQRLSRPSCREVGEQTASHQRDRFLEPDAPCCDCASQLQHATDELRGLRAAALLSQLAARPACEACSYDAPEDPSAVASLRCDGATSCKVAEAALDQLRETVARHTTELQSSTEELQTVRADAITAALLHQQTENALRMTLADVEARLVASRAQCEAAERAKLEIIHQATQLVQAAEAETGTALSSLDAFNQMQLRPWIDVATSDRTAKYTLQTALAAANDTIAALQADVALEMAAARDLRADAEASAAQAAEWSALSDAYELVQAELEARVRSLSAALAQALSSHDSSVDWTALVSQLLAQPSPPSPQYPPTKVLAPDKAHVCSWQLQAATWRQALLSKELALQALQDQLHQQAATSSALDASKIANSALRKKAATAKAEVETWKAAAETAQAKHVALAREKTELNHMVLRLREENAKLRDSAQRKSELVAYYKGAAEKAKSLHDAPTRPLPASNPAPTAAKTALIKHLQEQLAARLKDAAATNDALQKAQAHNHVLSSRCARLQMVLRDKASPQQSPEGDKKDKSGDDATSAIQSQLRECRRRLQQKQSVVDGLKAKDAAQREMLATCATQINQLRAQLQSHSIDAAKREAHLAQLNGLRASVYDAVHSAFAFRLRKMDPVDGVSVSDLHAVGCNALDATEIALLQGDSIQRQVLSGLELALETSPEDCRRALLDALLELRHAGSAGKF
ncbi:hypothetical protein SPRG_09391 [Saprolegnia parasitica CBS 223.65]|uniref:Uncharacterized protein n=1 Tax=Saprolegnia parasitica (strain CBS 223.65) TaxID=695850 RepID=A0A067C4J0_SAPPC|nr:hypothetical protein SPRG_09391 [Saprolegnia parasitica CBS 223.65]KDO25448.1 hypothetical protein SPRG_09391 [Saprolegnia parasitica CBS 223.65]|eukprot:XP_012203874.1 hypothetical protein SPRG_09391 [Saprolegnia parasitica CBS 223.65]